MSIIIDLVLVLIVVICAVVSARRGFVSSLIGLLGVFLAAIIAFYGSVYIANYVFDNFIGNSVSDKIIDGYDSAADEISEKVKLPQYINIYSEKAGIDIKSDLNNVLKDNGEKTAPALVKDVIKPTVLPFVRTAVSLILFLACSIIFAALARLTRGIGKIPIIGGLNSFLGAVFGAVKGVVFVFAICFAISVIVSLSENGFWLFTPETLEKTYIYKFVVNLGVFKTV